ncbi:MAG: ATP-binding cassette domain-containing protein [Candidatus Eremiobacteraeota bacterium]|nr:ATP-binding cassette domain-containing protein [Candidatus Eremiobacteraeota bacterium]
MISVERLVVRFPGAARAALNGIDLDVLPGERLAILGASGSGKTTLLRAIAGFVTPVSGRILVDGRVIDTHDAKALRAQRRRIGMIAQSHDMVERLSVERNVLAGKLGAWSAWHALRALVHLTPGERAEAKAILERVGIGDFGRRRTGSLSGGERQRVAIARALAQNPRVVLADEPIASLDEDYARRILELLCRAAEEERVTLVCTLHQPALAHEFFHRVVRLDRGSIGESSPPLHV